MEPHEVDGIAAVLAPTGILRVAINVGNPVLASLDDNGCPVGVSVDLAAEIARRLSLGVQFEVFDTAAKSVDAVTSERADLGFFAVDPLRGAGIAFTDPYVLIKGCYLVRQDSPIMKNEDVDQPGIRVTVGRGSAYDLFLTRNLKYAEIERAPSSPGVVDYFLHHQHEVAAGVKQQLEADADRISGLRLLPEKFMVIAQALGVPKTRDEIAISALNRLVREMIAGGCVAAALQRHGINGASVAF